MDESELAATPFLQFDRWFSEAIERGVPQPEAMTLATAGSDGVPAARTVLLKSFDEHGFVLFTNYESRKSRELDANSHATLLFFWSMLERQIRIDGIAERVTAKESDDYFATRPRGSQLGAWASAQSREIESREVLERQLAEVTARFDGRDVSRPPHWGGWRIVPHAIEFWQGRPDRLHDRLVFRRSGESWRVVRLSP
jgi:pyridoxamine 5'-phosphate oxidase